MQTGTLNRRVVIQQPSTSQDTIGQPAQVWTTLATVWANVRTQSGMERIRAGAQTSTVQASIRIRRRTDVTAGMRAVLGSTVYNIRAVLHDEETRESTDLVCEAIA